MLLDEAPFPKVEYFKSSPSCRIPAEDESAELVYSSHHFEHLDDLTVFRLLAETRRVLSEHGSLLVKIPNFGLFKRNFANNDNSLLEHCGTQKVEHTWARFGVASSPAMRTAMMFCGYWNREYGDHFSKQISRTIRAYHGPPVLPEAQVSEIIQSLSVREISGLFNRAALSDPEFKQFNHQNAWDEQDFIQVVEESGFKCLSTSLEEIKSLQTEVPDLLSMSEISSYYLFRHDFQNRRGRIRTERLQT